MPTLQRTDPHIDLSRLKDPELHLDVSTLQEACAAPGRVYTTGGLCYQNVFTPPGSELHLDLSGQQEHVLLLDMFTTKRCERHLEVSRQQESYSTCSETCKHIKQGPELRLDVSILQKPLLAPAHVYTTGDYSYSYN